MKARDVLPEYPRTPHLPFKPNRTDDDPVCLEKEAKIVFDGGDVSFQEKLD